MRKSLFARALQLMLNPSRMILIAELVIWVGLALLMRTFFSIPTCVRWLNLYPCSSESLKEISSVTRQQLTKTDRVGNLIERIVNRLGIDRPCVVNAFAARLYLAVRGIPCALVFGASKGNLGSMEAHAWLVTNQSIMTGYRSVSNFTAVSAFFSLVKPTLSTN